MKDINPTALNILNQLNLSPKAEESIGKTLRMRKESLVAGHVLFAIGLLIIIAPILQIFQEKETSGEIGEAFYLGLFIMTLSRMRIQQTKLKSAITELLINKKQANDYSRNIDKFT